MNIAAIDTETASKEGGMIEFAAVSENFNTSFMCDPGVDIQFEAMAVHHITPADIDGAISEDDAMARITSFGFNCFIAHNAAFDSKVLSGLDVEWICTLKLANRFYPDAPSYKLQVLRYWLNLELGDIVDGLVPHRALYDAWFCWQLYLQMKREFGFSDEDAVEISSEPMLVRTMPFGKHRGKPMSEVAFDLDYCEWLYRNVDLSDDINFSIEHFRELSNES